MRRTGLIAVVSALALTGIPASNAYAAPLWYVVFECNIRANIATKGIYIKDKQAAYDAQMDYCLSQFYGV